MVCPICHDVRAHDASTGTGDWKRFECPRCGNFEITGTAEASQEWKFSNEERVWAPYNLRQIQQFGKTPRLATNDLLALKKNLRRPTPFEAADNLIKHLSNERRLGHFTNIGLDTSLPFIVGVPTSKGLRYLAEELEKRGLVNIDRTSNAAADPQNLLVDLSFSGWERCEALLKGAHSGRYAFMAMQFGEDELLDVVNGCFKPTVSETGFELRLLNDPQYQRAGLIDDRLRVEVKGARFLVVDLTHANNGAYWEAGYGEGLAKPVIYTCKKSVFEQRKKSGGGTHFDTNHHLHILWDSGALSSAADELRACIRATIPEAKNN